jgi:hypothetical protein
MRLTRKNLDLDKSIYFEATMFMLVLICLYLILPKESLLEKQVVCEKVKLF